ncbi:Mmp37-domain-containing protein [Dacryopinax primogenitus]|uniref:Phosphatidate cytidylyltransferase, mitochondrial n=1 Tax=Dacryopinax primogenitus (strain DJM 731) TaxID=1858805 RepID=M5FPR0_DACPD|nr:Mmp37-domain-containing protein [Dacryopinax primogenitus]EJT98715.1 Mmp37-domain-containing protein [Dacryopinax primogenitus]
MHRLITWHPPSLFPCSRAACVAQSSKTAVCRRTNGNTGRRADRIVCYSTETELPEPRPTTPPPPFAPVHRPTTSAFIHPRPRRVSPPPHPSLPPSFGRNQFLSVPDETKLKLNSVVASFNAPIRYAFAYGSGVFPQTGNDVDQPKPMLDFIFAVSYPAHWHSINMTQNPSHYPFYARALGSSFVSHVQRQYGAGVWYCTYVCVQGELIKYGVISMDTLCQDLLEWDTLYVSGRMHKPIRIVKDDARVRLTQQVNLVSAVRASLLMLPEEFTEEELWASIAGLSYSGDPRMSLPGENPNKIRNIVSAQHEQFHELYERLVRGIPGVHWREGSGRIKQDCSPKYRASLLRKLPQIPRDRMRHRYDHLANPTQPDESDNDENGFWMKVAEEMNMKNGLASELSTIIRRPAVTQSLKGLISAGPMKSTRYALSKVGKWWSSGSS